MENTLQPKVWCACKVLLFGTAWIPWKAHAETCGGSACYQDEPLGSVPVDRRGGQQDGPRDKMAAEQSPKPPPTPGQLWSSMSPLGHPALGPDGGPSYVLLTGWGAPGGAGRQKRRLSAAEARPDAADHPAGHQSNKAFLEGRSGQCISAPTSLLLLIMWSHLRVRLSPS